MTPATGIDVIQLEKVSKVYQASGGVVRALDQVDLEVARGEFVAVRGPSGSGKSTLLSITGGLDTPTAGSVTVAGNELTSMSAAERTRFRAKSIGFVFQVFHLLPYLTVVDNVLVAAAGGASTAAATRARQLLERFGLVDRLRHRPAQLSIGERQRVAMARALLNEPSLLLADEPTGNLDPDSGRVVLDMLAEFRRGGGTVLLVTHEEFAAGYADRTVQLRGGRMEEPAAAQETG